MFYYEKKKEFLKSINKHKKYHPRIINNWIEFLVKSRFSIFSHSLGFIKPKTIGLKFDVWEESFTEIPYLSVLPLFLKNLCKKIFLIDIDKKLLKNAKKNLKSLGYTKSYLVNGNIAFLPFQSNSFEIVIDFSTTDHLKKNELLLTLREVSRVLKKNGIFVIYHLNSEYFNIQDLNKEYRKHFPSYPRKISFIKKILEENNFQIIRSGFCYPFFADPTLFIFYRIIFRRIYRILPSRILSSFFNLPKFNLFFFIIAKKI